MNMEESIGDRLKRMRKAAGLSQTELAAKIGRGQSAIGNIESGIRGYGASVIEIARVLGTSPWYLQNGTQDTNAQTGAFKYSIAPEGELVIGSTDGAGESIPLFERALAAIHSIAPINNPDYPAIRRVVIKAQAGHAVQYQDAEGPPIWKHKSWFAIHGYDPAQMIAIHVTGDSMSPNLCAGDEVLVDCTSTAPIDGKPFVVSYGGDVIIKRLVSDSGAWRMSSDNPDKSKYPHKTFDHHAKIIGEVVVRQTTNI